jgi:hypothetical protein
LTNLDIINPAIKPEIIPTNTIALPKRLMNAIEGKMKEISIIAMLIKIPVIPSLTHLLI